MLGISNVASERGLSVGEAYVKLVDLEKQGKLKLIHAHACHLTEADTLELGLSTFVYVEYLG